MAYTIILRTCCPTLAWVPSVESCGTPALLGRTASWDNLKWDSPLSYLGGVNSCWGIS